ncbi:MAG: NUDIX hydrolase [Bacteroidota bacterium]
MSGYTRPFFIASRMNFCSHCGSDQLTYQVLPLDTRPRLVCGACQKVHYQNPRMVVGCLPIKDDKILLCRRAISPQKGYWNLPAGFMEVGETVEEAARRETWEESQAEVSLLHLHVVYSILHVQQVIIFFQAQVNNDHFQPDHESLEVTLFAESEIPWDELAFSSNQFALEKYFTFKDHPEQKVHFGHFDKAQMGKNF